MNIIGKNNFLNNMSPTVRTQDTSIKQEFDKNQNTSNIKSSSLGTYRIDRLLDKVTLHSLKTASVKNLFVDDIGNNNISKTNSTPTGALMSIMNNPTSATSKSNNIIQNIFSEIGNLNTNQKRLFLSNAQNTKNELFQQVSDNIDKKKPNNKYISNIPDLQLSFSITTQDGDKISVDINKNMYKSPEDDKNLFAFTYQVEGELSIKEQKALDNLYKDIGKVSDNLFTSVENRNISQTINLKESFDSSILSGFNINFSGKNEEHNPSSYNKRDEFTYSYKINQETNMQTLEVGIEFKKQNLHFDLNTSLTGSYDEGRLNAYIDEVKRDTIEFKKETIKDSGDFIQENLNINDKFMYDSFKSMFQTQTQTNTELVKDADTLNAFYNNSVNTGYHGLQSKSADRKQKISTLADFNFNIIANHTSQFFLEQKTQITETDNGKNLSQSRSFEAITGGPISDVIGLFYATKESRHELSVNINKQGAVTNLEQTSLKENDSVYLSFKNTPNKGSTYTTANTNEQTSKVSITDNKFRESYQNSTGERFYVGQWKEDDKMGIRNLFSVSVNFGAQLKLDIIRQLSTEKDSKFSNSHQDISFSAKKYINLVAAIN
ncbi:hypothetical protein CJF42_06965 [Pseudoalteromonas sp. NBT06-2]|uniref:hypothetical protein n=1 Tax=Pseudoalteromonas sp. NBT06-2 TaxID=2025950 RepID=UPI000BA76D8D|nr:hypothetical protein [Pseudoalteromonas sp. NBT06-2]PAJ75106.1 hypothetical protein CJF42_06965 [Pseudoalteromonas sp. NBT06-2]